MILVIVFYKVFTTSQNINGIDTTNIKGTQECS